MHPLPQSLLREFVDVFTNDLALGLPPSRGVEHKLDPLLGSFIQKKLAYVCNSNEPKEL